MAATATGAVTALTCRDCAASFVFTAGDSRFYASKGFVNPTRCPGCRALRKKAPGAGGSVGLQVESMTPVLKTHHLRGLSAISVQITVESKS